MLWLRQQPVVATELEFFVFAANADPLQPFQPPLGLDGRREDGGSAFSVSSNNGLRPFFNEVYRCMAALGLPRGLNNLWSKQGLMYAFPIR